MQLFTIVKLLIINEKNEVLLIRRGKSAPRRAGEWDFPGGFVDPGEELMHAALRETDEEVGIKISRAQLLYTMSELDEGIYGKGAGNWLTFSTRVHGRPNVVLGAEHDEYTWVPLTSASKFITYHRQLRMLKYILDGTVLEGLHEPDA